MDFKRFLNLHKILPDIYTIFHKQRLFHLILDAASSFNEMNKYRYCWRWQPAIYCKCSSIGLIQAATIKIIPQAKCHSNFCSWTLWNIICWFPVPRFDFSEIWTNDAVWWEWSDSIKYIKLFRNFLESKISDMKNLANTCRNTVAERRKYVIAACCNILLITYCNILIAVYCISQDPSNYVNRLGWEI